MTRPFISMLMTTLAFAAVPLSIAQSSQPQAQVVDGIAAVVNGEVITYSQVRQVVMPREQVLRQQFHGADLDKQLKAARDAALKDLIDRQLIVQDFKKQGFNLPDWLVEQRIDEIIRENFGGDRNTFVKTLQAQNVTLGQFKKEETDKIIVQAMRGKNIKRSSITVSPTKVQEYWEKHRAEFMSKEQVKLRMIMIPTHGSDAAQQKTLAEEILGKLAAGSPFDKMAEMYSEDSTREMGGDWGWIERKTLAAPLEKVAFNLPRNKISNIIELGGNYYILKVEDKRGGDAPSLAQIRPQIEQKLQQEEMQKQQDLWLATLREKAYIRTF
jgi:parvulin-like peptidyl-prolyl isomerase